MTPLAALLHRIGWTCPEVARRIGRAPETVYRWHCGVNRHGNPTTPPGDVIHWLERVADGIEAAQPPTAPR